MFWIYFYSILCTVRWGEECLCGSVVAGRVGQDLDSLSFCSVTETLELKCSFQLTATQVEHLRNVADIDAKQPF